jgi:Xaa-Pro dipeptidase
MFDSRMSAFRARLDEMGIDVALNTDDDNVYYLTDYYDYLHMEFGRPTILVVHRDGPSLLVTPTIDFNSARAAARVDRIARSDQRGCPHCDRARSYARPCAPIPR